MARHTEPLDGGLLDGPDPATLKPGQLSSVTNAVYKSNAPALQRARGRVTFGTATAASSDINGLRDCQFDVSAGHYLIAQVSGAVPAYVSAFMGDTGTFGIVTTAMTAGSSLDRVHFRNRFYLLNGASASSTVPNSNLVLYLSATAASSLLQNRQHGMLPVSATPNFTTAAGTFSQTVTGYYEYWTTEVAKLTADSANFEMESTFVGAPATVYIPFTTTVPTIQMPPKQNLNTTHWRIYRSAKKDKATDKLFPTGFMVGDQAINLATSSGATASTPTFVDTLVASSTGAKFAASFGSASPYADFTSPANMGATDGVFSTVVCPPAGAKQQSLYNFNFGGFTGSVIGVEVIVRAYVSNGSGPIQVGVGLGQRGSDGKFTLSSRVVAGILLPDVVWKSGLITSTSSGSLTTLTLGGSTDRWWPADHLPFSDDAFGPNFMVVLQCTHLGFGNNTLSVDSVTVNAYYAGSSDSIVQFKTVVYTFSSETAQVGANGPPPSARTGDVYQDQLVTNDESNLSLVRYSYPGDPEAFPSVYFLDLETEANDAVQLIKVVNNRVIVCTNTATYRLNYLPSERDASFDRGKAIEPISEHFGCLNPMCACIYSMDTVNNVGAAQRLAWVSQKGIHTSDSWDFITLTQNLNWRAILGLTGTVNGIALINDPENQELLFYYSNSALGNEADKCLHLNYSSQHALEGGRLKISGKVNMRNWSAAASASGTLKSAWSVPRSNGDTSVFLGYGSATAAGGGMVYRENGTVIPAQDPNMRFITRRMYLAGEGSEWTANDFYAYVGSNTSTAGIDFTLLTVKTNDDAGEVTKGTKSIAFAGRKHGKTEFRQISEGLRISANASGNPNNDIALEHLIIDGTDFGEEDSGK